LAAIAFATQREGSKRKQLTDFLLLRLNQHVPEEELLKALYGPAAQDMRGALAMVLKGVKIDIDRNKQPARLERKRVDKVTYFGLFSNG